MDQTEVKNLIEEFLKHLTVQFDTVECIEEEVHPIFLIKSSDSGVLIGNNGENLRALNYLVRKMVGKKQVPSTLPLWRTRKRLFDLSTMIPRLGSG